METSRISFVPLPPAQKGTSVSSPSSSVLTLTSTPPALPFAGPYYSDTVNLGGFQTAPTFSFECAESQGGFFLGGVVNATGLLGFGPSALSAWAQLTRDSDVPPIFSMCLSRNPIFKSTLFLGGVPPIDNLALDFVPRLPNGNFAFWDSGALYRLISPGLLSAPEQTCGRTG